MHRALRQKCMQERGRYDITMFPKKHPKSSVPGVFMICGLCRCFLVRLYAGARFASPFTERCGIVERYVITIFCRASWLLQDFSPLAFTNRPRGIAWRLTCHCGHEIVLLVTHAPGSHNSTHTPLENALSATANVVPCLRKLSARPLC